MQLHAHSGQQLHGCLAETLHACKGLQCLLPTNIENSYSLNVCGNTKGRLRLDGTSTDPSHISVYKSTRDQDMSNTMITQDKVV